jgi:hypothetical protein
MRTLAVAIRSNGWSESSSLRPSADGIEPWVDPFLRAQVVSAVNGYARWLTGIETTAGNRNGLCLFPIIQVNHAGAWHCARRCCYIHLCSDAAGIIHQRADFP